MENERIIEFEKNSISVFCTIQEYNFTKLLVIFLLMEMCKK